MIEPLESRIAPAALHGNVLTYTDFDGDLVKITFTHAKMAAGDFEFNDGSSLNGDITTPEFLESISMTGHTGGGFTVTARLQGGHGDGRANIGTITSTNTPLGAISIDGDLSIGSFSSGSATIPSIKSLTVQSLGGDVTTANSEVEFQGINTLTVKADVANVEVLLDMSSVVTKSISIGGDLHGGTFENSAYLSSLAPVTALKIGGSVLGGSAENAGDISLAASGLHSLTIGGSIIGGVQPFAGAVAAVADDPAAVIKIGGSVLGSSQPNTGVLLLDNAKSLAIGGALVGSSVSGAGVITGLNLGSLTLGSIVGGDSANNTNLTKSGYVGFNGNVGSIKVTGGIYAGQNTGAAYFENDGMLSVKGKVGTATIGAIEGNNTHLAIFSVGGGVGGTGAAIKTLTITHSVIFGSLLAGYGDNTMSLVSANAGFGSIAIHGNFTASYITAGETSGADGRAGDGDDTPINNASATIGSIKIGGQIAGVAGSSEFYIIFASVINKLQVGSAVYNHAALLSIPTFDEIGSAYAQSLR